MKLWLAIAGMAGVTYLSRVVPLLALHGTELPGWARRWLGAVPYAALGALLFPGVLDADPGYPGRSLLAALAAFGLAWFRLPMLVVVAGAVLALAAAQP